MRRRYGAKRGNNQKHGKEQFGCFQELTQLENRRVVPQFLAQSRVILLSPSDKEVYLNNIGKVPAEMTIRTAGPVSLPFPIFLGS